MNAKALLVYSSLAFLTASAGFASAAETEACKRARHPIGGSNRETKAFYAAEEARGKRDPAYRPRTPEHDRDDCFLENETLNWFLGSLVVRAAGGASNGVFDSSSIGQRAVGELDETTLQYKFEVGYSERPFFRDIYLLTGSGRLDAYRDRAFHPFRVLVLDAFKFTLLGGWGTQIEPDHQRGRFTTSEDLVFDASVTYEIPLEKIGFPFME